MVKHPSTLLVTTIFFNQQNMYKSVRFEHIKPQIRPAYIEK